MDAPIPIPAKGPVATTPVDSSNKPLQANDSPSKPSSLPRRVLVSQLAQKETDIPKLRRTSKMFLIAAAGVGIAAVVAGVFFPPLCALLLVSAGFAYISHKRSNDAAKLEGEIDREYPVLKDTYDKIENRLSWIKEHDLPHTSALNAAREAIDDQLWHTYAYDPDVANKLVALENALNQYQTELLCSIDKRKRRPFLPQPPITETQFMKAYMNTENKFTDYARRYEAAKTRASGEELSMPQQQQAVEAAFARLFETPVPSDALSKIKEELLAWETALDNHEDD